MRRLPWCQQELQLQLERPLLRARQLIGEPTIRTVLGPFIMGIHLKMAAIIVPSFPYFLPVPYPCVQIVVQDSRTGCHHTLSSIVVVVVTYTFVVDIAFIKIVVDPSAVAVDHNPTFVTISIAIDRTVPNFMHHHIVAISFVDRYFLILLRRRDLLRSHLGLVYFHQTF
jgi:hypothetical protein